MNGISFPGLGIEEFWVNPVAFTVFGQEIRWYGILITVGIVCAYLTAQVRARREHIDEDTFLNLAMVTVLMGIIGARLYYVIFYGGFVEHGGSFWQNVWGTIKNVLAIRQGGLAIYGSVIAGALTIVVFARKHHLNVPKFLDAVAPSVLFAQAIGRWGNFMNGEAHGYETDIFCRMGLRFSEYGQIHYYHPTFLYESLWNLTGFLLIYFVLYKRKKFNGEVTLAYFAWYGLGRTFIEGLRTDSLWIGNTGIRVSQLVAAICFVVGVILIFVGRKRGNRIPALRLDAPSGCEARFEAEEKRRAEKTVRKNGRGKTAGAVPVKKAETDGAGKEATAKAPETQNSEKKDSGTKDPQAEVAEAESAAKGAGTEARASTAPASADSENTPAQSGPREGEAPDMDGEHR